MMDIHERLTNALADRYAVTRELGAGGMATVYLAHDLKHERDVAIKVLHPDLGAALGAERFLSEIKTTAKLQHPHILPLLDSGAADGLLYYVMPYVRGETLRARLERERQLPLDDALRIAREVAGALDHAHKQGIIHRDIKPESILLQDGAAVVADFGIALAVQSAGGARMTQTGLSLGTPQYMSPEQAMGDRILDARSDIYALGAVTYEMLAGEPPFTGASVQGIVAKVLSERPVSLTTLRDTVGNVVDTAVMKALAKLPADRYASARAFTEAMSDGIANATSLNSGPSYHVRDSTALSRLVIAMGATALLVAGVAGGRFLKGTTAIDAGDRFTITQLTPPPGQTWNRSGAGFALSSDGRTLAVINAPSEDSRGQLSLRRLDEYEAHIVPGTDDALHPFWSADGQSVGFHAKGALRRVELATSEVRTICETWQFNGGTWNEAGDILFGADNRLMRRRAEGGPCTELHQNLSATGAAVTPSFFNDGVHYLASSWNRTFVGKLGSATLREVKLNPLCKSVGAGANQILSPTGQRDLLVRNVDLTSGVIEGQARLIAQSVWSPWCETAMKVSREGTMIVAGPGEHQGKAFVFAKRGSTSLDSIAITSPTWVARMSNDRRRMVLGGFNVRLLDLERRTITELAPAPNSDVGVVLRSAPIWAPGDDVIWMREWQNTRASKALTLAYTVRTSTGWDVYMRALSGGAAVRISHYGGRLPAWRADSRELFFVTNDRRVMVAGIAGDGKPTEPKSAFENSYLTNQSGVLSFDVSADGNTFFMLLDTGGARGFSVISNWPAAVRAVTAAK